MPAKIDLTGLKFGRLTVVREKTYRTVKNGTVWICVCECGTRVSRLAYNLLKGDRLDTEQMCKKCSSEKRLEYVIRMQRKARSKFLKKQWEDTRTLYGYNDEFQIKHDIREASGLLGSHEEYAGPTTSYSGDCCGTCEPEPSDYGIAQGFEHMRGVGVSSKPRNGQGVER